MRQILFAALLAASSVAAANERYERIIDMMDQQRERRSKSIEQSLLPNAHAEVKRAVQARINPNAQGTIIGTPLPDGSKPITVRNKRRKQNLIDSAKSKVETLSTELKVLKDGGDFPFPYLSEDFNLGDIGKAQPGEYGVVFVIDDQRMILRTYVHDLDSDRVAALTGRPRPMSEARDFIVRKFDTAGVFDGRLVELSGPFEVVESERYGGIKYPTIEPVDLKAVIDYREKRKKKNRRNGSRRNYQHELHRHNGPVRERHEARSAGG